VRAESLDRESDRLLFDFAIELVALRLTASKACPIVFDSASRSALKLVTALLLICLAAVTLPLAVVLTM